MARVGRQAVAGCDRWHRFAGGPARHAAPRTEGPEAPARGRYRSGMDRGVHRVARGQARVLCRPVRVDRRIRGGPMSAIKRIDFIGFTVMGPRTRSYANYMAKEWTDWKVDVRGPQIVVAPPPNGTDSEASVPLTRCVVYYGPTA